MFREVRTWRLKSPPGCPRAAPACPCGSCEGGAHVEAEDGELHTDEGKRHAQGQEREGEDRQHAQAGHENGDLHPAVRDLGALEDEPDRIDLQAQADQEQQREEEPALLAVRKENRPCRVAAASGKKAIAPVAMSGSLEMTLGWLWCAPCFCSHQE